MRDSKVLFHTTVLLFLVVLTSTSCTFEIVKPLPPIEVAFKSSHGRYVTAMAEDDDWAFRQETELSTCGRFIQHHLANGMIALETCHDMYVTAPQDGTSRLDWMLGQEPKLGDCGQFELYDLGSDRAALKTCAGNFFTAGGGEWPSSLAWSVVAETGILQDWEIFTVQQQ
jgi:hypothetical protein